MPPPAACVNKVSSKSREYLRASECVLNQEDIKGHSSLKGKKKSNFFFNLTFLIFEDFFKYIFQVLWLDDLTKLQAKKASGA